MPVDPQVQEYLDTIAALNLPPHYEVGPDEQKLRVSWDTAARMPGIG